MQNKYDENNQIWDVFVFQWYTSVMFNLNVTRTLAYLMVALFLNQLAKSNSLRQEE